MEVNIHGKNWWFVEKETKHIVASTAKELYKDYWDDYFKFSFVRNPWDRMLSMARIYLWSGVRVKSGKIDISEYLKKYPKIEVDPRSKSSSDVFNPISNSVYLNLLNEQLDFIGRFENLQDDYNYVLESIGMRPRLLRNNERSHKPGNIMDYSKYHDDYTKYYNDETVRLVAEKYAKDIEYFGYKFGE